ncbi:uncharacterized protein BDZ99DRAFT_459574 [Mytilinidion resinicola]|uniref:Heterokaryon incompatibility domain-containing protein n=1 Tax=Mytilinidion resinicola TaxID=574789 RepID=A0A6A6YYB8_9PEZI|nr:uncharacterized protein BDZ99DRAFT_459574 [Mytilinidion resinicola]KAF2813821.1 hypothetical protein BDZ99DRAFT_459574 [Mytilinidion resinicola]
MPSHIDMSSSDALRFSGCSSDVTQEYLSNFFRLPWCSRLWVIQEVSAGNSVLILFGAFQIPWDHVGLAVAFIERWLPQTIDV